MAQSPPYLYPFVCFVCRRSFKRRAEDRDEMACPVCGNTTIRLSRKFKPPRRADVRQWAKVEALVRLGFRFDTIYDNAGVAVRYPATERGIPAFVERVTRLRTPEEVKRTIPKRRRKQAQPRQRVRKARRT